MRPSVSGCLDGMWGRYWILRPYGTYLPFYHYISFHLRVNCAIVVVGPELVRDEGDRLALKVIQVTGVDVELVDIKVVLRVRIIVFVYEMDRFKFALVEGICRIHQAAA